MSRLRQIVARHTAGMARAGAADVADIDRDALRRDLRRLDRRNQAGFYISAVMLLAVFALALAGVIVYRNHPDKITAVFAASGVTLTGIVTAMTKLWLQKTKSGMVTALLGSLDRDALQAALQSLLSTL